MQTRGFSVFDSSAWTLSYVKHGQCQGQTVGDTAHQQMAFSLTVSQAGEAAGWGVDYVMDRSVCALNSVHSDTHMHTSTHTCICTHIHTCTHSHTCTHTHIGFFGAHITYIYI